METTKTSRWYNKLMLVIYVLIVIVIAWSAWGYISSNVESAEYKVLVKNDNYEIRMYAPHIVAQTTVKGSYNKSLNEGFRIIAGYIFGNNTKKQNIEMTTPVVEEAKQSESINMTTPVSSNIDGEEHTITFVMPKSYTLETLPTPNDPRVQIKDVPERKVAALRFGWMRTENRVQAKKGELIDLLKKDGIVIIGQPQYAGYNDPWTPPWMTRNEILIEIK